MKNYYINGIQQIGLGVSNLYPSWQWYIDHFGFDLPIFDEEATANLMLPYTEGLPKSRHAVLALNYQGGGGLEIWNHTSFTPRPPKQKVKPGDIGITATIIKSKDIETSFTYLQSRNVTILTEIGTDEPNNYFYVEDPYSNIIKIVAANDWHKDRGLHSGGIYGCSIGVSDMDASLSFYQDILGYDKVAYEHEGQVKAYAEMGLEGEYHKVNLIHSQKRNGAFSKLLGPTQIELVQKKNGQPFKVFKDRMWGELGYIHLCFDVENLDALKAYSTTKGHPFTVDSGESFDMGEAAGRFAYTEDPDGTLIEFVETHKIPILKKIGLYYNLKNRPPQTPLPKYILTAMGWTRVKNVIKKG